MFWLAIVAQAAGLSATNYAIDAPLQRPTASPSWSDEFHGRGVDPAIWRFDTSHNRDGWFNHERQYYATRRENVRVADGVLTIEARHDAPVNAADYGGQGYSSGKLVSRTALGYGFYEVRAKLPCGRGMWPAIWLLPDSGSWPAMGEIDVMEMVGFDPNVVHATLHTEKFNHRLGTQRGAQMTVPTACTRFHRYQLSWRPHEILIGVDDHAYLRVADDQPGGAAAWPFTRPFHLILNLAVGGDWGGKQGIDDAVLPQVMTVDYARYWRTPGNRIALVHYLSDAGGGTAFYRHRSTGFETVDDERRPIFYDQLEAELRHGGLPPAAYHDGDSRLFERIALVEPRANRAVLYRSFLLHSGAIAADAPLSADPATGRLTVTGFFQLKA